MAEDPIIDLFPLSPGGKSGLYSWSRTLDKTYHNTKMFLFNLELKGVTSSGGDEWDDLIKGRTWRISK